MPISILGDGSITGITSGGLPDGIVTNDDLATGISSSKLTGALPALDGSSLTGTADATKLPLAGGTLTNTLTVQNNVSSNTDPSLVLSGTSNLSQDCYLQMAECWTGLPLAMGMDNSTNTFKIARNSSGNLNSGTQLEITSDGNVGIGVTPESISSVYPTLQIGYGGQLAANTTNPSRFSIAANSYLNTTGSGVRSYIQTDEASEIWMNAGTMEFKVAPSGTADAAISFTTALTIHNDGQSAFKGIVTETTSQSLSNGSQITHNGSSMVSCNASSSCTLASDSIQDPSRNGHILILTCGDNPPSKFTLSSSNTAKLTLTSNWSPDWGDMLLLFGSGNWWHEMGRGTNTNY
jgi:hypothetical protein